MTDFWLYFTLGLQHVLDIHAYDHVLFLLALTVPYLFKDWRNVLVLVTVFTVGHTAALMLSVYGVLTIKAEFVEFLIPITILTTALYNIFAASKKAAKSGNINFLAITTLFFGIIHGLGFSNYFKVLVAGGDSKFAPLLEFALGIEAAQIIVVMFTLILAFICQEFLRVQKRDWILVLSAFVAGVVIPMIIESPIW
ncbi:HupE / UreJ protein [Flavobacterium akiainvivens]|uniref:HupE / UreJ protein n=1 Tax=Flavobacterium akiainvivens TaxID=1202724 RepID=A0A0N0RQV7_9FLAO|nr:HupE/UreJ family protein [Flavobacterium akiainvivens]KOS06730.1 HupE / UreJ protein [Flavobacterium akiainvivens]SFQ74594.1 HupE / UreJ protein [Flavobacterium akiainvivens]